MAFSFKGLIASILPEEVDDSAAELASHALSAFVGNSTLSVYNTAAQTAVRSVVTDLTDGIDKLRSAFDRFESDNPLVVQAMDVALNLVRSQGLTVPTEEQFTTHVKAAIADVAGAFGVSVSLSSIAPASVGAPFAASPVDGGAVVDPAGVAPAPAAMDAVPLAAPAASAAVIP